MNRTLLTVSGTIPADLDEQVSAGRRPRADYVELSKALNADLVDHSAAARRGGLFSRIIGRTLGPSAMLAWDCFRRRRSYEVIVTDGEQVGLPLAILLHLTRHRPKHVMIVHIMSVPKKSIPFRALRLGRRVDLAFVYSAEQQRYLVEELGQDADRVVLTPFMVDTSFFEPTDHAETERARPRLSSAGLEFRDYPTLMEAVRPMDVDVIIAAASPWSKRADSTADVGIPDNVDVRRLNLDELRTLYLESDIVVVPLVANDFQAGITTILEAMAMERPTIVSKTTGQVDTIVEGITGVYVPPGDPAALRVAISDLLNDRRSASEMGREARRWSVENADIEVYARRLAHEVDRIRSP